MRSRALSTGISNSPFYELHRRPQLKALCSHCQRRRGNSRWDGWLAVSEPTGHPCRTGCGALCHRAPTIFVPLLFPLAHRETPGHPASICRASQLERRTAGERTGGQVRRRRPLRRRRVPLKIATVELHSPVPRTRRRGAWTSRDAVLRDAWIAVAWEAVLTRLRGTRDAGAAERNRPHIVTYHRRAMTAQDGENQVGAT